MHFSVFQPYSRAQGFEIQKNETAICATDRSLLLTDWKRWIYIERIAAENKYLERENKQIILSLIDFMKAGFTLLIFTWNGSTAVPISHSKLDLKPCLQNKGGS